MWRLNKNQAPRNVCAGQCVGRGESRASYLIRAQWLAHTVHETNVLTLHDQWLIGSIRLGVKVGSIHLVDRACQPFFSNTRIVKHPGRRGWLGLAGSDRLNPVRTAVPFWGQTTQIISDLSPKRDCGPQRLIGLTLSVSSTVVLTPKHFQE